MSNKLSSTTTTARLLAGVLTCIAFAAYAQAKDKSAGESDYQLTINPDLSVLAFPAGEYSPGNFLSPAPAPRSAVSTAGQSSYGNQGVFSAPSPSGGNQPQSQTTYSGGGQTTGGQVSPSGQTSTAGTGNGALGQKNGRGGTKTKGGVQAGNQKVTTGGKETQPVVQEPAPSLLKFMASSGYYDHYMFRGLDVGTRTSIDGSAKNEHFFGANAALTLGDFALGFWYMQSLGDYIPGGSARGGYGTITNGFYKNPLDFRTPQSVPYQEYDLTANYTFHLRKDLDFTAGLNAYWFSNNLFWTGKDGKPVDYTMEAMASLNWSGIPYINQNLSYYYDFVAFQGGYLEYKISGKTINLYTNGQFGIGIVPSVAVSADFGYNGNNNGWNSVEPAVDTIIRIADGLSLDFGVHYAHDLGSPTNGNGGPSGQRTDNQFWYTASLQYLFPTGNSATVPVVSDGKTTAGGKSIIPDISGGEVKEGRWRIAAGAGVRVMHTTFDIGRAAPFNYNFPATGGDTPASPNDGFAALGRDATYLDGTVFSQSGFQYGDGTALFSFNNASQVTNLDNGNLLERQLTYTSRNAPTSNGQASSTDADNAVVYPYINLSYELLKNDRFGAEIGVGYAYDHSYSDSGTKLSNLQQQTTYLYTYNLDEIYSTKGAILPSQAGGNYWLIYNGAQYIQTYDPSNLLNLPDYSPTVSASNMYIAAYRSAKLDIDMHSPSIPINLSFDITNRIQARLSFGPTFNVFDTNLRTQTDYQLLQDPNAGRFIPGTPINAGGSGHTGASVSGANDSTTVAPGSGKSSSAGQSRLLPGTLGSYNGQNLGTVVNNNSGTNFQVGAFVQLGVQLDLDSQKRWFMEAYARYDYIPSFCVSDGSTSVKVDASSFGAGIGVGLRF